MKIFKVLTVVIKRIYASFLSRIKNLIELSIQGGFLSSHVIISCGIKLCNIFVIVLLNKWTKSLTFTFWNGFSHWKPLIGFPTWTICFWKCYTSHSYGGQKILRLNLANTISWWQFWRKEDWTPDSTTKFDW